LRQAGAAGRWIVGGTFQRLLRHSHRSSHGVPSGVSAENPARRCSSVGRWRGSVADCGRLLCGVGSVASPPWSLVGCGGGRLVLVDLLDEQDLDRGRDRDRLDGHVAQPARRPLCGLNTHSVGVSPCRWPRTARLYRGMSLAQTPPGLPLTRRSPGRGSLVGAAGGGLPCLGKVRDAERRCPHERGRRSHAGRRRRRQGCGRFGVPRETRRAAGRPPMARTGLPAAPGSRHRGSVGDHPRSGGRAASPPGPSDSPSSGHLEEVGDLRCPEVPRLGWLRHPMLHSRRVSLRWGTTYAHGERTPSSVLPTAAQPPVDRLRTG
jgi:hypothetical protein